MFRRNAAPATQWLTIAPASGSMVCALVQSKAAADGSAPEFRVENLRKTILVTEEAGFTASDTVYRTLLKEGRLRELKKSGARMCHLLPEVQYEFNQVERPDVEPQDMADACRWLIKDLVGFAVDECVIDVLDIPSHQFSNASRVWVVCAEKKTIADVVHAAQDFGAPLKAIDVVETAQRNISLLLERLFESDRAQVLLCARPSGLLLTITSHSQLLLARKIELFRDVETGSASSSMDDRMLERVTLEIQRTLDAFDRQHGHLPYSRIWVGPGASQEALAAYLGRNLGTTVNALNLTDLVSFSGEALTQIQEDPALLGDALHAIGAALR